MLDVAIIGAGLAGLSLATRLQAQGLDFRLFEARERPGGRILGHTPSAAGAFRLDLGPGWIWPESQPLLAALLQRAGLATYPQWQRGTHLYLAEREAPPTGFTDQSGYAGAYRLEGGSWRLVELLLEELPPAALGLGHRLQQVVDRGDHVELQLLKADGPLNITCRRVVLTVPPRLLRDSIAFSPPLDPLLDEAMRATPTWMAGHAKAVVRYAEPFWRMAGLSGNGFAIYPGAALREIFDACSPDGRVAALAGFFGLPAELRSRYREDLEALLLDQLVRLFGPAAARPEEIVIKDWADDDLTATAEDSVPLSEHPDYGHPWLQLDHWNDKLHFGGTETAREHGGYLEGALESAARLARSLTL